MSASGIRLPVLSSSWDHQRAADIYSYLQSYTSDQNRAGNHPARRVTSELTKEYF